MVGVAKTVPPKDTNKESQEFKLPPKFRFIEGEKVLCFHGPLIYVAKCLQSRLDEKSKTAEYFIHYSGWNKSWDEWVPEIRVLKFNDTNVQKQKELQKAQKSEPKKKKKCGGPAMDGSGGGVRGEETPDSRSSTPVMGPGVGIKKHGVGGSGGGGGPPISSAASSQGDSSSDVPRKKRSRVIPTVETKEQFLNKVEIKIKIPDGLKPWLVDDWELIAKQKKLVNLPARISVDKILSDYIAYKLSSKSNTPDKEHAVQDVTQGVREYFNAMLPYKLLYKVERRQHAEISAAYPEVPLSQLYGATHLLRLFVKLGGVLAYTALDEKTIQLLVFHLHDFLKYIQKKSTMLFNLKDYIPWTPKTANSKSPTAEV